MRAFVAVVLLALAGQSAAQVIGFGSCPDVRGVQDFDIRRFYGRWYEIARFYTWYLDGQSCLALGYRPGVDEGLLEYQSSAVTREREVVTGAGEGFYRDSSIYFQMFDWQAPQEYRIVDTDYERYVVIHSCSEFFFGLMNVQYNFVMGRERQLREEEMERIDAWIAGSGINLRKFTLINQMDCPMAPTDMPGRTREPGMSEMPGRTREPGMSEMPGRTREPGMSEMPGRTREPEMSEMPGRTREPGMSEMPGRTREPGMSEMPGRTREPGMSEMPGRTREPGMTESPVRTREPGMTETPEEPKKTDMPEEPIRTEMPEEPIRTDIPSEVNPSS